MNVFGDGWLSWQRVRLLYDNSLGSNPGISQNTNRRNKQRRGPTAPTRQKNIQNMNIYCLLESLMCGDWGASLGPTRAESSIKISLLTMYVQYLKKMQPAPNISQPVILNELQKEQTKQIITKKTIFLKVACRQRKKSTFLLPREEGLENEIQLRVNEPQLVSDFAQPSVQMVELMCTQQSGYYWRDCILQAADCYAFIFFFWFIFYFQIKNGFGQWTLGYNLVALTR